MTNTTAISEYNFDLCPLITYTFRCCQADDFLLGTCDIRWVYMLAVVGCADCFLLGLLALTLGWRQIIHTEEEEEGPGYLVTNMGSIGPDIKTQAATMHDRWERELFRLCRY